jgi:hypothetical protein
LACGVVMTVSCMTVSCMAVEEAVNGRR